MKLKWFDFPIIIVFSLLGIFYTFFPHAIHQMISPDWLLGFNYPHSAHVIFGIALLLITTFYYYFRRGKFQ